ncbi:unnamed protein product [Urochloa humidicola]
MDEMDSNSWPSLPCDLLVEILRRLDTTAVIRSAGICKPWGRAVIANASNLRPHTDRFFPNILLGFFHTNWYVHELELPPLQRSPSLPQRPFQNVKWRRYAKLFHTPPPYGKPVSSRDGFVLLAAATAGLCLCNTLTGGHRFLPAAALGATASYVLVTGGKELIGGGEPAAVWLVFSVNLDNVKDGMAYQIFSPAYGEWTPGFREGLEIMEMVYMDRDAKDMVVCDGGCIYWLGGMVIADGDYGQYRRHRCAFAIDVHTERTWMMELPEKYAVMDSTNWDCSLAMATCGGGRSVSVIVLTPNPRIEVWVLVGDGQWTLRRTVVLLPNWPKKMWSLDGVNARLRVFCPRSGCLFGDVYGHDFVIVVDEDSPRPIYMIGGTNAISCYPNEMDWSTYISKLKYF